VTGERPREPVNPQRDPLRAVCVSGKAQLYREGAAGERDGPGSCGNTRLREVYCLKKTNIRSRGAPNG
jgi:hypothetical protein